MPLCVWCAPVRPFVYLKPATGWRANCCQVAIATDFLSSLFSPSLYTFRVFCCLSRVVVFFIEGRSFERGEIVSSLLFMWPVWIFDVNSVKQSIQSDLVYESFDRIHVYRLPSYSNRSVSFYVLFFLWARAALADKTAAANYQNCEYWEVVSVGIKQVSGQIDPWT